ncbi:MAG: hypothetical protein WD872_06845 [Pirellulaceae bacterium]
MSNPYQSPTPDLKQFADQPGYVVPDTGFGSVSQVRIVSVLNGVQGALEIPMGLLLCGMATLFPIMMRMEANNPDRQGGNPPPDEMLWVMTGVYLALGVPTLLAGILRIVAAVSNFRYRRRTLGVLSISLGMVSLLSCYCAPTSIGVLIYGLIVYLNPAVKAAFQMGDEGHPSDQILASFMPYRPVAYPPQSWPPPPPGGGFGESS